MHMKGIFNTVPQQSTQSMSLRLSSTRCHRSHKSNATFTDHCCPSLPTQPQTYADMEILALGTLVKSRYRQVQNGKSSRKAQESCLRCVVTLHAKGWPFDGMASDKLTAANALAKHRKSMTHGSWSV
eukprot:1303018-Amphidinium_carterae.2